jgi:hypothetical protein
VSLELTLEALAEPEQLATLRAVFHQPELLRPEKTIQAITEEAAGEVTTFLATEALDITSDELKQLLGVSALDWSNISPVGSIA